ncbi:heme A synthase, partial [Micrococcus endophyticus]
MSPTPTEARTSQAGLAARLPDRITRGTFALAVASLASEIGIIVTGGAVRLTGSGLGCPTWPKCTPESLTNTPEMGIHGYIEFGNRTLTFVLVVIAAAMFLSLWRLRRTHRSPFWLSVGLLAGIPAQAIVGGIVVLTELDPWWVAGHFIVSSVMVAVATLLVIRIGAERRAGRAGVRVVDGV